MKNAVRKSTWSVSDWTCPMCNQDTKRPGPWCDLYCTELGYDCPPLIREKIHRADARNDKHLVDGLCQAARRLWGEGLDW